jgi:cytochrome c biogenesis protein CcdA/glutaredoxin
MKKIFRISILIINCSGLFGCSQATAQELRIFQTNSANGHLFPCRCPSEPKGGLAKQASLIKKLSGGGPHWLLESGDIFGINTDRPSDSLVLAAYQAMRYQAVAIGDQELAKGGDYFLQLKDRFDIPFISANLLYNGRPMAEAYRICSLGKPAVKAAVIGLISPKTILYYPREKLAGIQILSPEPALRSLIDSLKGKIDLFILLSHLGFDEEIEIAKKFPELALIIGGHSQTQLEQPHYSNGLPIIESGASGRRLTRAVLTRQDSKWLLSESKLYGINSDLPDDPAVSKIIGPMPGHSHHDADTGNSAKVEKSVMHVFVAPDCPDCKDLEKGLFARISRQYSGRLKIQYHKIDDSREYKLLLDYERLLNDRNNQVPAVVLNDRILGGVAEIEKELEAVLSLQLNRRGIENTKDQRSKIKNTTPENPAAIGVSADSIYLAFVTDLRCQKCDRAEYMLRALQEQHPRLAVRKFDLQSREGKVIAEALGILYDVPGNKRMIAPSAYIGDDHLIDDQIDDSSLAALISKYSNGTKRVPWEEAKKYITQAGQSILQRFKSFGVLGVMGAGLLDGLNPCSLAVLVFFISYLAFVGRKRWEILAVGISYTLADFLVYFLIGVGGLSFLLSLKALPTLSRILYWLAVIAGLILAVYNFRDYLKARKGDLSGMDLQLSTKTKQRIHKIIRDRMGAGGLIGGAFMVGLITSVLEFACTGQVYLPTIAFVSQISTAKYQAYGYLLLYNLMFEVPMIITFVIAFWGVSSKAIAGWAQASVSGVKLATAILFTVMSLALILILTN